MRIRQWKIALLLGLAAGPLAWGPIASACNNWVHYTEMYGQRNPNQPWTCRQWVDHFQCMDHWTPEVEENGMAETENPNRYKNYVAAINCDGTCGNNTPQDLTMIALPDGNTAASSGATNFVMCNVGTDPPMVP